MYETYVKTAARSLWRRRHQASINILGLAVGLAACLLIGRYVADKGSYDHFHKHADRIVRVTSHIDGDGAPMHLATSQGPLADALQDDLPGVEAAVRFISGGYVLSHDDVTVSAEGMPHADESVFDVFSFDLLRGDPETALNAPGQVVLTPALATELFGNEDPIGSILRTDQGPKLTVSGILKPTPQTSHLQFTGLVSMDTHRAQDPGRITNWGRFSYWTYVLLEPGMSAADLEQALPDVLARHTEQGLQDVLTYDVMPLTDIYLHSNAVFEAGATGSATALRVFAAVALFILLIAVINFVNLATARATERAREVGVRKTLGAPRSMLVAQFLTEAVVTALTAMGVALLLAYTALPAFDALAGTSLVGGLIPSVQVALLLVGGTLLVGLLAGTYPALILAGYRPAQVLRGSFATSREGSRLRQGLVVLQFAIAIALIAGTGVVQQQLNYVKQRDLGFSPEQMVTVPLDQDPAVAQRLDAIKRELVNVTGVEEVTASSYIPGQAQDVGGLRVREASGRMRDTKMRRNDVDADFLAAYGIDLLAGRGFDASGSDSTTAVLINHAAARHMGYADAEAALGAEIRTNPHRPGARVIGVVEDFHFASMHEVVEPLVLMPDGAPAANDAPSYLSLRIQTEDMGATMDALRAAWAAVVASRPFEPTFVDQTFATLYEQDRQFGRLFGVFAGLAIFVACLGLYGLTTHTVQQRTKEIGIRKALGASAGHLVGLLSKDVAGLVAVAFAIGGPAAYVGMQQWLDTFAYRIDLGAAVFLVAGTAAMLVALGTVGTKAWRAATLDPTAALRDE